MVRTIHDKVDDATHGILTEVKEGRDLAWHEFFDWLAFDVFGDDRHEIASMTDEEVKKHLGQAVEKGEWMYVARFAIEAESRDLTVVGAEVRV